VPTAETRPAGSYSRTSPAGPWDTIVIGSGMAGLTCAAMLGRFGRRVLVLEQHYLPGGMTHVFKRKGFTWDVGVHAVGEVTPEDKVGRLMTELTGGRLEWASLGAVCDEFHYPDGTQVDLPNDRHAFEQNLIEAFPSERDGIERYAQLVQDLGTDLRNWFLAKAFGRRLPPGAAGDIHDWIPRKTGDVLRDFTTDERLISLLSAQWGYYGADPQDSSFVVHALVVKHFWNGGFYPRGGSASIAAGLCAGIAEAGGWTRVAASVEGLLFDGDAIAGVTLEGGEEIRAARVVSAIGAINTVTELLPVDLQAADWAQSIAGLEASPAHVCLYLGFEGDIREAGASGANRWFYETWSNRLDPWHLDDIPDPIPVLYTSFPSLKDPDHDPGPKQRHTGEVVTFIPHADFERWFGTAWNARGADYAAIKADLGERILRQLLRHMPALEPMIRYQEVSTPLSTTWFTRATEGAIYGIKPTPLRFGNPHLTPKTPVEGLFLSSADIATVGVMGAFLGGIMTASAMEPLQALRLLKR
jgi:all-trans-retinol 13,14-reductase